MEAPQKQGTQLMLAISGMYCGSCVGIIESILGAHKGVIKATVNFATEMGHVIYDPEQTTPAAIIATIEEVCIIFFQEKTRRQNSFSFLSND